MGREAKVLPEIKIKVVEKYLAGERSVNLFYLFKKMYN